MGGTIVGELEGPAESGGGPQRAGEAGVPRRPWAALAVPVHVLVLSLQNKAKRDDTWPTLDTLSPAAHRMRVL
jgi:hypothetical protein